jgi:uncharacterized protein RhaS with RHS repeats
MNESVDNVAATRRGGQIAAICDPTSERFSSEDPIAFGGGVNFDAYVRNNPSARSIPSASGREKLEAALNGVS